MSQSTLYRRNLQRRARSQENLGDTRHPIIRIITGVVGGLYAAINMDTQSYNIFKIKENSSVVGGKNGHIINPLIVPQNTFNNYVPLTLIGVACTTRIASSCLSSPFIKGYSQGHSQEYSQLLLNHNSSKKIPFRARTAYVALLMTGLAVRYGTRSTRSTLNINKGQHMKSAIKVQK